jgi:hypothetical protein
MFSPLPRSPADWTAAAQTGALEPEPAGLELPDHRASTASPPRRSLGSSTARRKGRTSRAATADERARFSPRHAGEVIRRKTLKKKWTRGQFCRLGRQARASHAHVNAARPWHAVTPASWAPTAPPLGAWPGRPPEVRAPSHRQRTRIRAAEAARGRSENGGGEEFGRSQPTLEMRAAPAQPVRTYVQIS